MSEVAEKPKRKRTAMRARTPEARENQLIALAMDLAERKLKDGTASSQIITALLNLGTTKARLELDRMRSDLHLSDAKVQQIQNQESSKEIYEKALRAFKGYQGDPDEEYEEEDY